MGDGRDGWERDFFDDLYWGLYLSRTDADADAVADRLWRASGLAGSPKGRLVLDQGCGAGEVARAFARLGADVVAIDLADGLVARGRAFAEPVEWRVGDATAPLATRPDRAFDLVYNFNSGIGYAGADVSRGFVMRAEEALAQGRPYLVETFNGEHLLAHHAARLESERVDARDGRRWRIVRESRLSFEPGNPYEVARMLQDWTLEPSDGGPALRRSTAMDVMTPQAFGAIAKAAGLNPPVVLDADTLDPATPDSPRVILRFTRGSRAARDGQLAGRMRAAFADRRTEPAILDGAASLTGGDCLDLVARTEAALRTLPPRAGTRTAALLLPRSYAVPVAMMAARVAGLAFCPLDADAPDSRLAGILSRLRPAAVIHLDREGERLSGILDQAGLRADGASIRVPAQDASLEAIRVVPLHAPAGLRREASHVVFTSGSTGRPKAVLLRESGLLAVVDEQARLLGDAGGRPGLWALNPAFDASLSDILCPLLSGRALLVHRQPPVRVKAFGAALRDSGTADVPPSMLGLLDPTGLSACIFGGERADPAQAARWGSATRALQAYGPTETSVCVAMARAGGSWPDGLLGRPLMARTLWLREADGTMRRVEAANPAAAVDDADAFNATVLVPAAPDGAEGEILVSGTPLGIGYMDDPEAEARRFVEIGGRRFHATGDIARWADGHLRWLGRDDRQVKLNGRLVCPEEIEAAVGRLFPGTAAACLPRDGGLVLAIEGGPAPDEVGRAVAGDLGPAFRPRSVRTVEAFPRTSNGKVDLVALALIVEAPDALAG